MECNGNDRCQWQKQGVAVGAAASRLQGSFMSRRKRWEPQPVPIYPRKILPHNNQLLVTRRTVGGVSYDKK